jgi:hypothetical protein
MQSALRICRATVAVALMALSVTVLHPAKALSKAAVTG